MTATASNAPMRAIGFLIVTISTLPYMQLTR
jgi:hypothetical protein